MFPVAPEIVIIVMTLVAALGVLIGVLSGLLTSLILRLDRKGFWKDALLGGIATFVGLFAAYTVPWPEHIIYTPIGGGGEMSEISYRFPYPFLVAYVFAAILPIMRQLYRLKRPKSSLS
jgi:hypothetical protein